MIVKTLQLVFQTAAGSRFTISLPDPVDTLTEADVQAAMDTIIAKNVFNVNGADLTGKVAARIVSRETTELAVA